MSPNRPSRTNAAINARPLHPIFLLHRGRRMIQSTGEGKWRMVGSLPSFLLFAGSKATSRQSLVNAKPWTSTPSTAPFAMPARGLGMGRANQYKRDTASKHLPIPVQSGRASIAYLEVAGVSTRNHVHYLPLRPSASVLNHALYEYSDSQCRATRTAVTSSIPAKVPILQGAPASPHSRFGPRSSRQCQSAALH